MKQRLIKLESTHTICTLLYPHPITLTAMPQHNNMHGSYLAMQEQQKSANHFSAAALDDSSRLTF